MALLRCAWKKAWRDMKHCGKCPKLQAVAVAVFGGSIAKVVARAPGSMATGAIGQGSVNPSSRFLLSFRAWLCSIIRHRIVRGRRIIAVRMEINRMEIPMIRPGEKNILNGRGG